MYSIVVPVYKTETYIQKCINSILNQTYTDFELLLIDDGSPDNCPSICDSFANQDARVQSIHKENGGVSSARNLGISLAKGEYILFIDSDDYIDPGYLQDFDRILRSVTGEKQTFIITDYESFKEDGIESRDYPKEFEAELSEGGMNSENFRQLIFDFILFPPYCKLYRRDVITDNHLLFDTGLKSAGDFDFNIRYLLLMDKIHYVPSFNYHYRLGNKKYVPSNRGVLGNSEIRSAHIMADGIISLAKRVGLYEELEEEINLWAAKKHFFNRLPMLFAKNKEIGFFQRYTLYRELINNKKYHDAFRKGIKMTPRSTTRFIGKYFDFYVFWWLFYKAKEYRQSGA